MAFLEDMGERRRNKQCGEIVKVDRWGDTMVRAAADCAA